MANTSDNALGTRQLAQKTIDRVTTELLEQAIRQTEKSDDIKVKGFTVEPASKHGDNMGSMVLRVKADVQLDGTTSRDQFIVKTSIDKEDFSELNIAIFTKEIGAYSIFIPAMVQMQKDQGIEPIAPRIPRFYYGRDETKTSPGLIVLDDLSVRGFRIGDKAKGYDYEHCAMVVQELATWHALSLALKRKDPEEYKKTFNFGFKEVQFGSLLGPFYGPSLLQGVQNFMSVISSATTCSEEIKARVAKLAKMEDPLSVIRQALAPVEPYAVVCHGDSWGNNMMFRYETAGGVEKLAEINLIDLQIVRYSLPTTDLSYFLFFNASGDMRRNHMKDLLKLYHGKFTTVLQHVKCPCPELTLDVVEDMFRQTAVFGWLFSVMVIPFLLSPPETIKQLEDIGMDEYKDGVGHEVINEMLQAAQSDELTRIFIGLAKEGMEYGII